MNSKNAFVLIALAACCIASTGCTRVKVRKVTASDKHCAGIRYYRPKPYLFITAASAPAPKASAAALTVTQGKPIEVKAVSSVQQKGIVRLASAQDSGPTAPGTQVLALPADTDATASRPGDSVLTDDTKDNSETGDTSASEQKLTQITMKLEYLPDFAEEYAIDFRPGLGSGELNVDLENGWNLTSIGIKTDQQTDEIIGSVGTLLSGLSGFAKDGTAGVRAPASPTPIYGSNVPFGFYEAVIASGPCGQKQLYGWRYVGFMPFQACPVNAGGKQPFCCNADAVFGLVFVNGALQFQEIGSIPKTPVNSDGTPNHNVAVPAMVGNLYQGG